MQVINSELDWNPYSNTLTQNGQTATGTPEATERYQRMLNNFHAMKAIDPYAGKEFHCKKVFGRNGSIGRRCKSSFHPIPYFSGIERSRQDYSKRLGRKLEAYDIWYDGFKPRSNLDEDQTGCPDTKTLPKCRGLLKQGFPSLLTHLGFHPERANEICDKIAVDAARGSGHAWGAAMKGQQSHLRTSNPLRKE